MSKAERQLHERLLHSQLAIARAEQNAVVLVTAGMPGAGVGGVLNRLNQWLDNRNMATHAFAAPTEEERQRPPMWRYWRGLPPRGRFAILVGAWYGDAFLAYAGGRLSDAGLAERLETIARLERLLAAEGTLVLKCWYPISRTAQYARLRALEADPEQRWRVSEIDWLRHAQYSAIERAAARARARTDAPWARWHSIQPREPHQRALATARVLAEACEQRLAGEETAVAAAARPPAPPAPRRRRRLAELDLEARLDKATYRRRLAAAQERLARLSRSPAFRDRAVAVVFEGQDAAGKGGVIRRLTEPLDPRYYRVVRVAGPSDEERARPWLWRFWRALPGHGRLAVFDRSWYGRVLVERVEGLADEPAWQRAYEEINDFEAQLLESRISVVKLWLAIDADEQLRRFRDRQAKPHKRHKITDEDWRNRQRWAAYEAAVEDMLARTSTRGAPWEVVPANDKRYARVRVLEHLAARLEAALELNDPS